MVRKRTLAEELADLATPGPVAEADFEGDELSGPPVLIEDFETEAAQPSRKAKEKKSRLRADIALQGPAYSGRRTSRAAAFETGASSDAAESASQSGDDSDQQISGESASASDRDDDSDANEAVSDGEEEQQSNGSSAEEDDDASDMDQHKGSADAEADEAAELERQYAEVAKQDDAALANIKARNSKERTKGLAVQHQKQLWEKNLELRILLQKCLTSANRLPHGLDHAVAVQTDASLAEGYRALVSSACETIDSLLRLQTALTQQHPAAQQSVQAVTAEVKSKGKRKREQQGDKDEALQYISKWQRIDEEYAKIVPFRDASIDRWHRKTMLISGSGALRGNLRALNQSVSTQVSMLMKDPSKQARRSGVPHQQRPRVLCHMDLKPATAEATQVAADSQHAQLTTAQDEEVDFEMFQDGEFYAQLLKEFLEGSGAGKQSVNGIYPQGKKKRKQVDRRASKGRKLRYHVQDKLVNFMAAVEQPGHELAVQLFSSLFGGSK